MSRLKGYRFIYTLNYIFYEKEVISSLSTLAIAAVLVLNVTVVLDDGAASYLEFGVIGRILADGTGESDCLPTILFLCSTQDPCIKEVYNPLTCTNDFTPGTYAECQYIQSAKTSNCSSNGSKVCIPN